MFSSPCHVLPAFIFCVSLKFSQVLHPTSRFSLSCTLTTATKVERMSRKLPHFNKRILLRVSVILAFSLFLFRRHFALLISCQSERPSLSSGRWTEPPWSCRWSNRTIPKTCFYDWIEILVPHAFLYYNTKSLLHNIWKTPSGISNLVNSVHTQIRNWRSATFKLECVLGRSRGENTPSFSESYHLTSHLGISEAGHVVQSSHARVCYSGWVVFYSARVTLPDTLPQSYDITTVLTAVTS